MTNTVFFTISAGVVGEKPVLNSCSLSSILGSSQTSRGVNVSHDFDVSHEFDDFRLRLAT